MPYSKFSLKDVKQELGIGIIEDERLFFEEYKTDISDFLKITLEKCVPVALAVNTEKSRSEWIIAPILIELKERLKDKISIFSGKRLDNRGSQKRRYRGRLGIMYRKHVRCTDIQ